MYITNNDVEFIIRATSCVYESKKEPGTDTAATVGELAINPTLKRYLRFVVREQKYMTAMMELLKRTCTPVAITGPICQNTGKTSQQAIVVDLNKIPFSVGYNRMQLERATRRINAKALEVEIFKISQQIVDAAAKFMAISQGHLTAAELQPIKNRVSDDLWAAFMVMQDVTGIKKPTQTTQCICQHYHEYHLSQKTR